MQTQANRPTYKCTDRQRKRQKSVQIDTWTDRQNDREKSVQTDKWRGGKMHKRTDG